MRGKISEAKEVFEFIVEEDPHNAQELVNLGFLKMRLNNYMEAERLTRQALMLDSDYIRALLNLASVYPVPEDRKAVSAMLGRVLEIPPGHPETLVLRKAL